MSEKIRVYVKRKGERVWKRAGEAKVEGNDILFQPRLILKPGDIAKVKALGSLSLPPYRFENLSGYEVKVETLQGMIVVGDTTIHEVALKPTEKCDEQVIKRVFENKSGESISMGLLGSNYGRKRKEDKENG